MTIIDGIKQATSMKTASLKGSDAVKVEADGAAQRQAASAGGKEAPAQESGAQRMAVIEAAGAISSFVQNVSRELRFDVDEQSGRTVIMVMDRNTDQVIRQIPSEEVLALAKVLEESTQDDPRGVLINNEA
ncbi:MAG: flagellar protein FlaG [Halieaceae bacterium]|nr:flagellar protein FlaG [Halieaceae bacterium]